MSQWPMVKLDSVTVEKPGTRNPLINPDEYFRYVDISSVDNTLKKVVEAREIQGTEAPSRARKIIRTGDVIVSTTRPNLNAVALIPTELDGQICSTGFCVLRPTAELLDEYLFYFTKSEGFVQSLSTSVAGALYPAVSDGQVRDLPIPLPPLAEQRRIVDLLNHAAGIRRLRQQALTTTRALIPALFVKIFGDPARNEMGWKMDTVGNLLESAEYGTSLKASEEAVGVPVLRMGNVTTQGELNLESLKYMVLSAADREKYRLQAGDLLFNRTNSKELVGKTGIWDNRFEAVAASYFIRLRVDGRRVDPWYVWCFFNSKHMKKCLFETARGAIGQANINAKEVKAFALPVPPLALQQTFAAHVADLHALITQQERHLAQTEALLQSLMARFFGNTVT